METARSFLFVPGNRPDRFAKAESAGPDLVILDLEDAVAPAEKERALHEVVPWAAAHGRCMVRVNGLSTPWGRSELEALRGAGVPIMLPKSDRVADLLEAAELSGGAPLLALVETPRGVQAASALADSGMVARLALGNVDLAASLGVDPASRAALAAARSALVAASAAASLPGPVDGVTTALDDPDRLVDDLDHAKEMGLTGRLCIHPRQVGPTNTAMSPSPAELAWAQGVLDAEGGGGVVVLDGAMLDAPVFDRARRLVARSRASRIDNI
ncbi:hypothetical protein ASG49_00245 [Marmoricola sp. Leaf446]|nr:hypothetical protein ASG49_00245 [Marmoricola sp. Leaf446]